MATLQIDRWKPFNLIAEIGKLWSVHDEDSRALGLTEIDLSKVRLKSMAKPGESISYEEMVNRLNEQDLIPLDARVGFLLSQNQQMIPKEWRRDRMYAGRKCEPNIYLFGTQLKDNEEQKLCTMEFMWCKEEGEWLFLPSTCEHHYQSYDLVLLYSPD